MQTKTLAMLGAVLAVLVLIAWVSGAFESDPSTLDVPDLSVERSAVESIEIVAPDFAATVDRSGGRWTIEGSGNRADSVTVRSLLLSLEDLEAMSVVSRSPERYDRYGVDSTATYVRLRTDDKTREYWIASTGPDARTGYVRIHGDERVFAAVPRVIVPTSINRWRDRRIFSVSQASITRVGFRTPDGPFELVRDERGWTIDTEAGGQIADSTAVARYLDRFDPFRVDGFLESFDDAAEETHSLTITMQDGSTWSLSVREQGGALAARIGGVDEAYRLLSTRRSTLFPDPESLTTGN
ncbi:MAG: DUF4340 domain-containing protein [Rhodothermales bacterium]|nr:DUF4340 domain-containing protein [Rhodothermales bacterium]